MRGFIPAAAALLMATTLPVAALRGQCNPGWQPGFEPRGVAGRLGLVGVHALAAGDIGPGPTLYVGGLFELAGSAMAKRVAMWDGTRWASLGPGLDGQVEALTVFDDGAGPALYAGGAMYAGVRKYDGTSWSMLGPGVGGNVYALTVFDDGTGPALYVGGQFDFAGGQPAHGIAKWDGTAWSPLGDGVSIYPPPPAVYALAVFDDGTGPALYAGGYFTQAGDVTAYGIARWNGTEWSAVGGGCNAAVRALAVFDDGSGPALYAGGDFEGAGGNWAFHIAKWDGAGWSALGSGTNAAVETLAVFDDGTEPALHIGGRFTAAGGVEAIGVAKWDGLAWSALGAGAEPTRALCVFDDGRGPALYAGGDFKTAGGLGALRIAKWDGATWSALGNGNGAADMVTCAAALDDPAGVALYASGVFRSAGGAPTRHIARWSGANWSPLGTGIDYSAWALAAFDDGSGLAVFAGGDLTMAGDVPANKIAKWDGASWSALGAGIEGGTDAAVDALAVFHDGRGPALYVGGRFDTAGGAGANNIARWDGASWSPLGTGCAGGQDPFVGAFAVFNDGRGPGLFVGGRFTEAGGVSARCLARWDGQTWSSVGGGVSGGQYPAVGALAVFDDGTGPAVYVGGLFTKAGTVPAKNIAKWNGTRWSALGSGLGGPSGSFVNVLAVFDDGTGPALYAGGYFTVAGGVTAKYIAKWDGVAWSAVGAGTNDLVLALTVFDDGTGPALFAGGPFTTAGGRASAYIAKWGCPPGVVLGDSNCDGAVDWRDVDPFVLALSDRAAYEAEFPDCNWLNADCNTDGRVDFADIDPLVVLLGG